MLDSISFRPAIKSDIPQLVDLMNSQYTRKKGGSYFIWQYFDSYHPTILMCAFSDSQLVGMFGLQERKLQGGAHVGQAIDLLVAPEWRKKGIFRLLGEKAIKHFKELDLICVLPNLNGKNACKKAFGWKSVSKINSMILDAKSLKKLSEKPSAYLLNNKAGDEKFYYDTDIRQWRYDQSPDYEYTYVRLDSGEFAVTKIFKEPGTGVLYGDIVDFECNLNDMDCLTELFFKASINLKENKVESVMTWALPHMPLRKVLESVGFVEFPQERYFCMKVLKQKYEYLYDLSRWHLVQADAEIY